ncbi:MAG: metallophosphoesterase [Oscillospiraceae bacterium]
MFVLTAGIVGYGVYNARQIKLVTYDVQLNGHRLPNEMTIVLLSDLHLGATDNEQNLAEIVRRINELKPDLVCMAGDVFNDNFNAIQNPAEACNLLKSIRATYGVYASMGNHDSGHTFHDMECFLEESNIKLLNDAYVTIDDRLVLMGRLDPSPIGGFGALQRKDTKDLLAALDTDLPVVVMDHNPAVINQYGGEVDLILSGHTHGGHIVPGNFITKAMFTVSYGYYQKDIDSPQVIVSSGAGTWGTPLRVGSNNEIVRIRLQ